MKQLNPAVGTAAKLAVDSLRAHKLRSFLTLLGVIIGVTSVVVVGAAIDGLGAYAEETTSKAFGSQTFQIGQVLRTPGLSRRQRIEKFRVNKPIREDEYKYLLQTTGEDIIYSPYRFRAEDLRAGGKLLEGSSVIGTSADLAQIREVNFTEGRYFTPQEERSRVAVAVIGDEVRQQLFADVSPIGKTIKVGNWDFRVVGLQEKIGGAGPQSQDNVVFIPATVFNRIYGPERSMVLFARPRPGSTLGPEEAADIARVALRTKFKTRPGKEDNFDTVTPDSIKEFIGRILGIIGAAVVPITCISLVVGGIVIMNIMLVSVTERTREIGVRKSLGARQSDLMLQFLFEAVLLSSIGGVIGLGIGVALAQIATLASGVKLSVTMPYILLSLIVSGTVGVLSGWYPARRAARMDPVEALRAE
jgi:putative ABC transport system permease protein